LSSYIPYPFFGGFLYITRVVFTHHNYTGFLQGSQGGYFRKVPKDTGGYFFFLGALIIFTADLYVYSSYFCPQKSTKGMWALRCGSFSWVADYIF